MNCIISFIKTHFRDQIYILPIYINSLYESSTNKKTESITAYLLANTSISLYKILVTDGAGESEKVESSSIYARQANNSE